MKINCEFDAQLLAVSHNTVNDKTYYKGQIFTLDSHECGELNFTDDLGSLVPGNYHFVAEYNDKYKSFKAVSAIEV